MDWWWSGVSALGSPLASLELDQGMKCSRSHRWDVVMENRSSPNRTSSSTSSQGPTDMAALPAKARKTKQHFQPGPGRCGHETLQGVSGPSLCTPHSALQKWPNPLLAKILPETIAPFWGSEAGGRPVDGLISAPQCPQLQLVFFVFWLLFIYLFACLGPHLAITPAVAHGVKGSLGRY